jgi:hypothetical protein
MDLELNKSGRGKRSAPPLVVSNSIECCGGALRLPPS